MIRPAPGLPISMQPQDVILRMTIYGEARGESAVGKLAVAFVLKNRAEMNGTTIKNEALKPWQFSTFNENDPNREKLLTAWATDPAAWRTCDAVAELFERCDIVDPTHGATHYLNRSVLPKQPSWSLEDKGWAMTVKIGDHEFGNTA